MAYRTQLELIHFSNLSPFDAELMQVIKLNQIPTKEGWAVVLVIPSRDLKIVNPERRLLFDGFDTIHKVEALLLTVFRPKTFDTKVIDNYVEHFTPQIPYVSTGASYKK